MASAVIAEAELVAAVLQRDRKAAAEFVDRYADAIYTYVRHRLLPRSEPVDDLVQEVFLAAWAKLGEFRFDSTLTAWLLGIARHKVEDYYRARVRELQVFDETGAEEDLAAASDPPADRLIHDQQVQERTRRILESLPEPYSLVLLWRYWEKRTVREIASQAGKTEKAVERLLARAREQFKRRWRHA